jgi:hypothetical protein
MAGTGLLNQGSIDYKEIKAEREFSTLSPHDRGPHSDLAACATTAVDSG